MRIFAALEPSPAFLEGLSGLQEILRSEGIEGQYQDVTNLHMTLAFIGEWQEDVTDLLPLVTEPFHICLNHVGIFEKAKVLWAGVEESPQLEQLAASVRESLTRAQIPFDPKPFNPHITLIRKPHLPSGLSLQNLFVPEVSMTVREVCLYRSAREEHGMVYTVIGRKRADWDFGGDIENKTQEE